MMNWLLTALLVAVQTTVSAKKLPPGVIEGHIEQILNTTVYGVNFGVGTPRQNVTLLIDTGSQTIGIIGSQCTECRENPDPCQEYGTYNNLTSSSASFNNTGYADELEESAYGNYINDVLYLSEELKGLSFGQILGFYYAENLPETIQGIFGLNAECNPFDGHPASACEAYPTFVEQLVDLGYTPKNAFSIYLGSNKVGATGSLLIGGVDRAKQQGPVHVLDIVNPVQRHDLWNINYTAMSITHDGHTTHFDIAPDQAATWDTGSTNWAVPTAVFNKLASLWGLSQSTINATVYPPFPVNCSALDVEGELTVGFTRDAEISMPVSSLLLQLGPNQCLTNMVDCGESCGPGNLDTAFGAPFLRNVYATYNAKNGTIAVSRARYTDEECIEAL